MTFALPDRSLDGNAGETLKPKVEVYRYYGKFPTPLLLP